MTKHGFPVQRLQHFLISCPTETDHQLWIPIPNSGIWLAHFFSSVNFWFNSSVARKAWSWGREASGAIKIHATDKQIMKVLANGKEKEEERLWKKDKMLTTQKYYKHLTRNTSRIKQCRRAGQNYCVKGQPSKSVSFLYTSDNQLANLIFKKTQFTIAKKCRKDVKMNKT